MTKIFRLFAPVCLVLSLAATLAESRSPRDTTPCEVIQHALIDAAKIKVGDTRGQVEKYFVLDGGGQFRESSHYVYSGCHYPLGISKGGPLLSTKTTQPTTPRPPQSNGTTISIDIRVIIVYVVFDQFSRCPNAQLGIVFARPNPFPDSSALRPQTLEPL